MEGYKLRKTRHIIPHAPQLASGAHLALLGLVGGEQLNALDHVVGLFERAEEMCREKEMKKKKNKKQKHKTLSIEKII